MKRLICILGLLCASCCSDIHKPIDRTSPEYQEVLYRLWRQWELRRFEKWYNEKYCQPAEQEEKVASEK